MTDLQKVNCCCRAFHLFHLLFFLTSATIEREQSPSQWKPMTQHARGPPFPFPFVSITSHSGLLHWLFPFWQGLSWDPKKVEYWLLVSWWPGVTRMYQVLPAGCARCDQPLPSWSTVDGIFDDTFEPACNVSVLSTVNWPYQQTYPTSGLLISIRDIWLGPTKNSPYKRVDLTSVDHLSGRDCTRHIKID